MYDFENENKNKAEDEIEEVEQQAVEAETSEVFDDTVYEPDSEEKPVKKSISKFKVAVASVLALALFLGTAVGFSLPQIMNNDEQIAQNSTFTNHNIQKTTTLDEAIQQGRELSTQEIAALVGPAIVGVENIGMANYYYYQTEATRGSGSGVLISEDGYIVTNYHVIENATRIKVILSSGASYDAKVVGADAESDLALIKIEDKGLPFATLGDSSNVMVGDRAIAIGNPLGTELMGTVTQGIISAVNRTVQVDNRTMTLLQTDAAINSGNSGGALINAYGEVIGINSVKMAASGVEGLGFAIPSNTVNSIISDLKESGYVRGRLSIGIAGTNVTAKMAQYYDMPVGFYIQEVYQGSGAYLAGLKPGDIIVKCDGTLVEDIDDINEIKKSHKVGDTMKIQVVREGKNMSFDVVLQEEKPERAW